MILDEGWERNSQGRRKPAYGEALEYVKLVAEQGYALKTFPMIYSAKLVGEDGEGPSQIAGFTPMLVPRILSKVGARWYASAHMSSMRLPEEVPESGNFTEGAVKTIAVNAYERSRKAREVCIAHYGAVCFVCGFDFASKYGSFGSGLIHVHHVVPIAEVGSEYKLDPVEDLRPVCPNCHAVIHRTSPPLEIEVLQAHLASRKVL